MTEPDTGRSTVAPAATPAARHGKLVSLEAGRFLAAALVLLYHYTAVVADFRGTLVFHDIFRPGHVGVPYFFVLSGFIIYQVHRRDIGNGRAWPVFAARRATRLYPMFWLISLGMLAGFIVSPGLAGLRDLRPASVVGDLLLLPHGNAILSISWTLRHEMVFYALFSLAIWFGSRAFWAIAAWIVASIVLGALYPPDQGMLGAWSVIAGTLNLGFGIGMIVAELVQRPARVPPSWCVAAGAVLLIGEYALEWHLGRGAPHTVAVLGMAGDIGYMIAAALLILGLVRLEMAGWRVPAARMWTVLGGASYTLYLVHQPIGSVLMRLLSRFHAASAPAIFAGSVLISVAVAVVLHLTVERSMLHLLNRALKNRLSRSGVRAGSSSSQS